MKIARVARLQGEIIEAAIADYHDYAGLLLCPCCSEPVFLRKAHFRNGQQVNASFVHHKGEKDDCELRVISLTLKEIESYNSVARNQRLALLQISCWEMLKTAECYQLFQSELTHFKRNSKAFYLNTRKLLIKSFNESSCRLEYKNLLIKSLETNLIIGKQLIDTNYEIVPVNYEMVKNGEIVREVINFCLTNKGKIILIEMIPTLCFLFKHILDDRRKFEQILGEQMKYFKREELILIIQINVILNWFLEVNWVEEFAKRLTGGIQVTRF